MNSIAAVKPYGLRPQVAARQPTSHTTRFGLKPGTRFGAGELPADPIAVMPVYELVDRKVAISLSKPVGVEKLLGQFSDTYEEKNRITFPYVMLAMAPFIAASFLLMPWLGFLGLPLSIYALVKLRSEHKRLGQAMRDQYRDLTTKLNIQPDFPLPYKGGPLPTKPAVTA